MVQRQGRPNYYAFFYRNGKQVCLSTRTPDREQALRRLDELMAMENPWGGRIKWSPEALAMLPGGRTTRQSAMLADRAREILGTEPERFAWLLQPKPKNTILAELGRCSNAGMLEAADHVCRLKLTTVPAVRFVHEYRGSLKSPPKPGWVALSAVRNQFPELDDSQIAEHLSEVVQFLGQWQEMTQAA